MLGGVGVGSEREGSVRENNITEFWHCKNWMYSQKKGFLVERAGGVFPLLDLVGFLYEKREI